MSTIDAPGVDPVVAVDPDSPAEHTGNRNGLRPLVAAFLGLVLGGGATFGGITVTAESDQDKLDTLASQVCIAINGESRIVASGMVGFAVHQAEDLGFAGGDLGSSMLDQCPSLYVQLTSDI